MLSPSLHDSLHGEKIWGDFDNSLDLQNAENYYPAPEGIVRV